MAATHSDFFMRLFHGHRRRVVLLLPHCLTVVLLMAGPMTSAADIDPAAPVNSGVRENGSAADAARWIVEDDVARWAGIPSPLRADDALAGQYPGYAVLAADFPWRTHAPDAVEIDVFWPTDTPPGSTLSFFAQDKDGLWFQAEPETPPARGRRSVVRFRIATADGRMTPVGHDAVWNRYYQVRMARAGFQFFCPTPWNGGPRLATSFRLVRRAPAETARPVRVLRLEKAPAAVDAFALAEFAFALDPEPDNPFDPDVLAVDFVADAPSGRTFRIPCFYDQPHRRWLDDDGVEQTAPAGRARWLARYTPLEPGIHRWRLEASGRRAGIAPDAPPKALTRERTLEVADAAPRGFVRTSPRNPRFLETTDGALFYPIGLNLHSPFDVVAAQMLDRPLPPDRGTFLYDDYFPRMRAAGMNAAAVWMANWWVGIEWNAGWKGFRGLNDYHLANAWRLDRVFAAALAHDIHLLLDFDNHGKFSTFGEPEWPSSPYAAENGGPCAVPEDFFAGDEAFAQYRKRLRYIVGRWGSYPNLLAFSLVSEINLTGSDPVKFRWHPSKTDWAVRAAGEISRLCPYDRMAGVQYSGNWPAVNPDMAARPELAFVAGNAYTAGTGIVPLYLETTGKTADVDKPFLILEYGKHLGGGEGPAHLRADLHAGLWATAMTPATGSPLPWWHDFIHQNDLWGDWRALARFMKDIDRRGRFVHTAMPPATADGDDAKAGAGAPPLSAVAITDGVRGEFWIYDNAHVFEWPLPLDVPAPHSTRPPNEQPASIDGYAPTAPAVPELPEPRVHRGVRCLLPGYLPGNYRVEYWDTLSGEIVHAGNVMAGPDGLPVSPPDFWLDVAGKAIPLFDAPAMLLDSWLRAAEAEIFAPAAGGKP